MLAKALAKIADVNRCGKPLAGPENQVTARGFENFDNSLTIIVYRIYNISIFFAKHAGRPKNIRDGRKNK
jgi:hypothetical protein